MVTNITACISLSLLILSFQASAQEADMAALLAEGAAVIEDFTKTLEGELASAIQSGGAVKAMDVCASGAPKMAAWIAGEHQASLVRISLNNQQLADGEGWQTSVLKDFETRLAAGESTAALVFKTISDEGGVQAFRMMQAIPTGELCLTCHGSKVAPNVYATLNMLYPTAGYSARDVRGAFVYVKPLDKKPSE